MCIRDRYDAAGTEKTIQALSAAVNSVPEGVAVYTMLVPLRINLEKELAAYSDDVEKTFREINEALPAKAQKLDVLKKLLEHRGEYLFFRTDNSWTALGGYYAAQLYCEAAGIEMIPLSEYWEWHLESFFGANTYMEKSDIPSDYTEYVSYYLLPGATNWAEVTVRRGSNYYEKFETPTIALSRRGTDPVSYTHLDVYKRQVIRWVDGEGLLCVNDNCNLGISASSAYGILLGKNCFFRRLYAPEIRLGCTFVDNQ